MDEACASSPVVKHQSRCNSRDTRSTVLAQYFDLEKIFGCKLAEVDEIIAHMEDNVKHIKIPKKDGSMRLITVPSDKLKAIQKSIMYHVMYRYRPSSAAHGFVRGKSTVTGARDHVCQRSMLGCDIKSFFDNITEKHVKNCLFGNENMCRLCSKNGSGCTPSLYAAAKSQERGNPVCAEILSVFDPGFISSTGYESLMTRVIKLTTYHNSAPQGFPTSPALANMVLRGFDKWMLDFCKCYPGHNLVYTRYADDITVSSAVTPKDLAELVLKPIQHKLFGFGFYLNKEKTRVKGCGRRLEVTGVVVNSRLPSLGTAHVHKIRAQVHLVVSGKLAMSWHELQVLRGDCAYLAMVQPRHRRYLDRIAMYIKTRKYVVLKAPGEAYIADLADSPAEERANYVLS